MEFEYNLYKSTSNKSKHGIDFDEAKAIWVVDNVILPAFTKDEKRYMIIGVVKGSMYSCIYTIRRGKIRIISCRKSREKEKEIYYEKIRQ